MSRSPLLGAGLALLSSVACSSSATPDAATVADGGLLDAGVVDGGGGDGGAPTYSWSGTRSCSGPAWAVGVLQEVAVAELPGRSFGAQDILWLDAAPQALPAAGAVLINGAAIDEALYTAAEAAHLPLIAWTGASSLELRAVLGRELLLLTRQGGLFGGTRACEVHVDDVTGLLDADDRAELAAARLAPAQPRTRVRLLPRPTALCPVGQESTSVWALYRNRPELPRLLPRRVWLASDVLESPHGELDLTHRIGMRTVRDHGPLSALPGARFTRDDYVLRDEWTAADPAGTHTFALELPHGQASQLAAMGLPLAVYDLFEARLTVSYPRALVDPGAATPVTSESIDLWPCAWIAGNAVQHRNITLPGMGELEYEVELGGPPSLTYFTAPITRVLQTRISGLTTDEVILDGSLGQSAAADHHNFSEKLVLEPGRDPSVPAAILQQLSARDIQAIYVEVDLALSAPNTASAMYILGRQGWRRAI